jgi:hypothetical protein
VPCASTSWASAQPPKGLGRFDLRQDGGQGRLGEASLVERVEGVLLVAVFADDLLDRPGALGVSVDQEVEDEPVGTSLVIGIKLWSGRS